MLKERIISALIGIPLILAVLYLGGLYWIAFFTILALGALYEFNKMFSNSYQPAWVISFLLMLIIMFYPYNEFFLASLVLLALLLVIYLVFRFPQITVIDLALSTFSAIYIGFSMSFALILNTSPHAFFIMLAIFLFTWSSDIGGYLFGRLWGKHKLAPVLSPNKTWEGSLGGIFLTIVTALIFFNFYQLESLNLILVIILGTLASIAAQLGDLFISSVKRVFNVKDSGNIIPGHGGILDRFDSFILVLPVVFSLLYYGGILS